MKRTAVSSMSLGVGVIVLCILLASETTRVVVTDKPIYVRPRDTGTLIMPGTDIAIRYNSDVQAARVQPGLFTLEGSLSGRHDGNIVIADDQRTIVFQPTAPFIVGEKVKMSFAGGVLGKNGEDFGKFESSFSVSPKPVSVVLPPGSPTQAGGNKTASLASNGRYVTAPASLPVISVTNVLPVDKDQYVFVNTSSNSLTSYLLILDGNGELVYYDELPDNRSYTNFTAQPNGQLTYFDGATPDDASQNIVRVLNTSYQEVGSYAAGDGYSADSHEFLLLPNGHALIMIYDEEPLNLTGLGGIADATFTDLVIQELDTARNVVFEWKASEHIPFTDTYEKLTGDKVDPYHGNAIEVLPDGNLLISFRHLSQVVKVDRRTGAVLWRMGGRNSDFRFTNDSGFSYQHDVRWLPNGHLTVFDNGNQHLPQASRAVEYAIDEIDRTATRVWEYHHAPDIYGSYMGDNRLLPDGNVWIGWGGPSPIASEVTRDGKLAQEIEIGTPGDVTYRWFKAPWQATPASPPTLVAQVRNDASQLFFSWNGATDVSSYRVEAGKTQDQFDALFVLPKTGFETSTQLSGDRLNYCYYRVVAVDNNGIDLRESNVVQLPGPSCA